MLTRREFLEHTARAGAVAALLPAACRKATAAISCTGGQDAASTRDRRSNPAIESEGIWNGNLGTRAIRLEFLHTKQLCRPETQRPTE